MSWEDQFTSWSVGPEKTEQDRSDNAESVIKSAINADLDLASLSVRVFPHGSYKARTNITQNSDVDICVCLHNTFYYDLPKGYTAGDFDISASTRTYSWFKNKVKQSLMNRFGKENVKKGNIAIDVHENSYRVDADVLPAFEYRRYTGFDSQGRPKFEKGIKFFPDDGGSVINWPQQSYDNGVAKNSLTDRKYKRIIRILKNLRNQMQNEGVDGADGVASCLLEHVCWNVPNSVFQSESYNGIIKSVLAHVYNHTFTYEKCKDWGETNELQYLFGSWQPSPGQKWTREQTNDFIDAAWDYIGY